MIKNYIAHVKSSILPWKSCLFIFMVSSTYMVAQSDPVLMKIGDTPVHLSEFTYIYEKNNADEADYSKETVEEYLNLFTNFKLKVEKAKALKMDTIQALNDELAGYRKQLARSYLMDKEFTSRLIKEMWERKKEDVNVSHILFSLKNNPSKAALATALDKAEKVASLLQGGSAWDDMVREHSDDKNSLTTSGNIGFINAFLPSGFYELENVAYNLEPGEISEPILTSLGYHIVRVEGRRPAKGKIEVAQILIRKDGSTPEEKNIAKAEKILGMIKGGEDFSMLAKTLSQDENTAKNGGVLKPFGINTYERTFEQAAFSLKNDGDITDVIETRVGWHIIKRISKPTEDYETFERRIKPQLSKMQRYKMIEDIIAQEVLDAQGYKREENNYHEIVQSLKEDFLTYKWDKPSLEQKKLFSIGKEVKYTNVEFLDYLKKNTRRRIQLSKETSKAEALDIMYDEFLMEKAMKFEEDNLEKKYPDFASLMREYEEGILLFEVSKNEVWDKASKDTSGLKTFFEKNNKEYYFPEEATIATYTMLLPLKKVAGEVHKHAEENSPEETLSKFNEHKNILEVSVETKILEKIKDFPRNKWKAGVVSAMSLNPETENTTFYKVIELLPRRYKTLDDSRGYVIADYQQFLEAQWIEDLKKEFNVDIKEDVLEGIIK